MELETGKDTTGRLMRVGDVQCENRSLLDSTFPERLRLPQGKANGEELSQLPLFWLPAGGNEKDGSEERTWLSTWAFQAQGL